MQPRLIPIAELLLSDEPGHVAAASGLVGFDGSLVVAVDDELALGVFGPRGEAGRLLPLDDGPLPGDPVARKAAKPDVEAVAALPDGGLLALGSGSTENRDRAWVVPPAGTGEELPRPASLAAVYAELRRRISDLNIEGAAVAAGALWLAQRGNGARGVNALVELDLGRVMEALAAAEAAPADAIVSVREYELGAIGQVALCFSDIAPAGDGLAFSAVAEDSGDTYGDGACLGAAIGRVEPRSGRIVHLHALPGAPKLEGLTLAGTGGLLAVADADDRSRPATLFQIEFG